MPNHYFKFKQFTIHQDNCAMKVCTDACLFGALVAEKITDCKSALDIGTGTGLLSLLLAQKNNAVKIDAYEIDASAALQANENITASPWPNQIRVIHKNILSLLHNNPIPSVATESKVPQQTKYDLIISNPPFFENDLPSGNTEKNLAKHSSALTLQQLLDVVTGNLSNSGTFAVLLPYDRIAYFIKEAAIKGFFVQESVLIKQSHKHKFFRGILFFSYNATPTNNRELIIKDSDNNYTPEFKAIMKDYYLFL